MKCAKRTVYETAVSTTSMKIAIDERFSSHDSRNRKLLILRGTKVIFGRTQHRACGSLRLYTLGSSFASRGRIHGGDAWPEPALARLGLIFLFVNRLNAYFFPGRRFLPERCPTMPMET